MSYCHDLRMPFNSTPTCVSPYEMLRSGLCIDEDFETSSGGRSRRQSDDPDNGVRQPEFCRASVLVSTPKPDPGNLATLHQAVNLFKSMNLCEPNSPMMEGNMTLTTFNALNQMIEPERSTQDMHCNRQKSFPTETRFPPPSHPMYRYGPTTMIAQQKSNSGGNYAFKQTPNEGFSPIASYGPSMPHLKNSIPMPIGYPTMPKRNGLTESRDEMSILSKFGCFGCLPGMFDSPHGLCTGQNDEIVVADTNNHRIQIFDKIGHYKFHFGKPGTSEGCLWFPRKVAVTQNGLIVVCDRGLERSRMQLFNGVGMFLRRIHIQYMDIVAGIAINSKGFIVMIDSVRPTLFIINPADGELVTYFDCSEYLIEPSDVAIYKDEYFICDFKGHSVVVFSSAGEFIRRISTKGVAMFPNGIDVSDEGDVLVGDSHGNHFHVAIFNKNGQFLSRFQCPQIKVSRCCGLKITSEGYIITLAKNNNFVLVLNTLIVG